MLRIGAAALAVLLACGGTPATPSDPSPPQDSDKEWPWDDVFSEPAEYGPRDISRAAGRDYFMRTGVGDPYGAGIPYPLFAALMKEYPDQLGGDWTGFNARFGTFFAPDAAAGDVPVGFYLTTDPNTRVQFLMMNCQICHTDRIVLPDGPKLVAGMGNSRVRLHAYGRALMDIARDDGLSARKLVKTANRIARDGDMSWPNEYAGSLVAGTLRALQKRATARGADTDAIGDGTPGRVATIAGFTMALNDRYGAGLELPSPRGWVKIPDVAVWRYRETNSFDGVAIGAPVAQVAGADFAFGVRSRWYREHRHISTSMFLFLRGFERSLDYPATIDTNRAKRGYTAFEKACAGCHGTYGPPGNEQPSVSYTEQLVDIDVVGTDPARLDAVTDEFVKAANSIRETSGLTLVRQTRAYVPRPLIDVWARGLYGHAGQWPSIAVLALPPDQRPTQFTIQPDETYDLEALGSSWREGKPKPNSSEYEYDATRPGFGVGGHDFLSDLPEPDRGDVIEYLKTL